jgi:hypothetical protein
VLETLFFSGVLENVLAGLALLVVSYVGGSLVARRRERGASKKVEEKSVLDRLEEQGRSISEMHTALVGAEPTPFNPNPQPGLVQIVPKLEKSVKKIEETLFTNGGHKNTVLDRLSRIEDLSAQAAPPNEDKNGH